MMLWPSIVIQFYEKGFVNTKEPLFLVLPTFLFADFLLEQNNFTTMQDIKVSLGLMMNNTLTEN
mgnify:CR=1 FL=1